MSKGEIGMKKWVTGKNLIKTGFLILAVLALLAYARAFDGPFVFDDRHNVEDNPSITSLSPPWKALWAEPGIGNAGRPLVNFTLALNYAAGGLSPSGYRLMNLLIHLCAGFLFFLLARRTLALSYGGPKVTEPEGIPEQTGRDSLTLLALAATAIFILHPMQTAAVTYVTQRSESLAALFLLLSLHLSIKGWETGRPLRWHLLAIAAMFAGAASKETIAAAPLVILLYDRTFVHGSFARNIKSSWMLYGGFLLALIFLGLLVATGKTAAATPLAHNLTPFKYLATQAVVVWHYVRLFFIPRGFCFDYYGMSLPPTWMSITAALFWIPALAATLLGLKRKNPAGFWGAWFFVVLAPSSSILPLKDLAFEHRMYPALAGLSVLTVMGAAAIWNKAAEGLASKAKRFLPEARSALFLALFLALSAVLALAAHHRNGVYESALALWTDTVRVAPANARARNNLGAALRANCDPKGEIAQYRAAVALEPGYVDASHNLANALTRSGLLDQALAEYKRTLALAPKDSDAMNGVGVVLALMGKKEEAIGEYRKAVALDPKNLMALVNMGKAYMDTGQIEAAGQTYAQAVKIEPRFFAAQAGLGDYLAKKGDLQGAAVCYESALAMKDGFADVQFKLAVILSKLGRDDRAIAHYARALELDPGFFAARYNLGNAFLRLGEVKAAVEQLRRATQLQPKNQAARENLDIALKLLNRRP